MPAIIHPQFSNLIKAIIADDITRVRKILRKFSLLRDMARPDFIKAVNADKKSLRLYFYDYIVPLATHLKTPEMIYEILAAGFPVYDLMLWFKKQSNYEGLYILNSILPNINASERNTVKEKIENDHDNPKDDESDNEFEVCKFSNEVPKIPVRICSRSDMYDLNELVDAMIKDPKLSLSTMLDWIVLDNQYVEEAQRLSGEHLSNNESVTDQDLETIRDEYNKILAELDALTPDITDTLNLVSNAKQIVSAISCGILLKLLDILDGKVDGCGLATNRLMLAHAGIKLAGFIISAYTPGTKLNICRNIVNVASDIIRDSDGLEDDLEDGIANLLARQLLTLIAYLYLPSKKDIRIEKLCSLEENKKHELDQAVIKAKYSKYDFSKLRESLTRKISCRFHKEFTDLSKYPSLVFWINTFELEYAKSFLLRMLGRSRPTNYIGKGLIKYNDLENITEDELTQANLQSNIPAAIVSRFNRESPNPQKALLIFSEALGAPNDNNKYIVHKDKTSLVKYKNAPAIRVRM